MEKEELHHARDDGNCLRDTQRKRLVEAVLPRFGVLKQLRDRQRRRVEIRRRRSHNVQASDYLTITVPANINEINVQQCS